MLDKIREVTIGLEKELYFRNQFKASPRSEYQNSVKTLLQLLKKDKTGSVTMNILKGSFTTKKAADLKYYIIIYCIIVLLIGSMMKPSVNNKKFKKLNWKLPRLDFIMTWRKEKWGKRRVNLAEGARRKKCTWWKKNKPDVQTSLLRSFMSVLIAMISTVYEYYMSQFLIKR